MKITLYSDKDCVLRYNEKWPISRDYPYGATIKYYEDMQTAKDQSLPFENQLYIKDLTDLHNKPIIRPETFYTIEIKGKVEIISFSSVPEIGLKDGEIKVARIVPEQEEETQEQLWDDMLSQYFECYMGKKMSSYHSQKHVEKHFTITRK